MDSLQVKVLFKKDGDDMIFAGIVFGQYSADKFIRMTVGNARGEKIRLYVVYAEGDGYNGTRLKPDEMNKITITSAKKRYNLTFHKREDIGLKRTSYKKLSLDDLIDAFEANSHSEESESD